MKIKNKITETEQGTTGTVYYFKAEGDGRPVESQRFDTMTGALLADVAGDLQWKEVSVEKADEDKKQ